MADGAIVAEEVERRFGSIHALRGVTLRVDAGEIYGFLGPNGAGKTTFVRTLCTLVRPTAGRAVVAGHDVVREPRAVRLAIGVALQEAALDAKQTGRELLRLQGRLYGLRTNEIDRRLEEVLRLVDIGGAVDRRIGTYSGGMRRRLDLAASLVHQPSVLFLDEPTTGLDPQSRAAVWSEVRRLRSELGMTIFLTTQYLEEADALADRVGIITGGQLVREGTPAELKRSVANDVIEVRVEDPPEPVLEALRRLDGVRDATYASGVLTVRAEHGARLVSPVALALGEALLPVQSVTLREPTLDDVFLEVTGRRPVPLEKAPAGVT